MALNPQETLLAELSSQPAIAGQIDERAEFVSMVKMQSLVRVTCLEVMQGAAPAQIDAYRREVLELQQLVKGYLGEVRELRAAAAVGAHGGFPPSSPDTASLRSATESVPGSPGPLTLLTAADPLGEPAANGGLSADETRRIVHEFVRAGFRRVGVVGGGYAALTREQLAALAADVVVRAHGGHLFIGL